MAGRKQFRDILKHVGKILLKLMNTSFLKKNDSLIRIYYQSNYRKYQLYCTQYNGYRDVTNSEEQLFNEARQLADKAAGQPFMDVETAKSDLIKKLREMTQLTKASITQNILSKTLESDGEEKDISKDLSEMNDTILKSGLTGDNFKKCIDSLRNVSDVAYNYFKLGALRSNESGTKSSEMACQSRQLLCPLLMTLNL